MALPNRKETQALLEKHVKNEYQRYHALMASDEIPGIFYAYRKLNPIPYADMKPSSIKKRLADKSFAAKIERETIYRGCEALGVSLDEHIGNLIKFFSGLK